MDTSSITSSERNSSERDSAASDAIAVTAPPTSDAPPSPTDTGVAGSHSDGDADADTTSAPRSRRGDGRRRRQDEASYASTERSPWLTYDQAADYTGWSVRYLRNLVSAGQIPVYGPLRSRRFRVDMLDLFLTDRDGAMRKFRLERNTHHAD